MREWRFFVHETYVDDLVAGFGLHTMLHKCLIAASNDGHFAFQSVCHVALLSICTPMRCAERGIVSCGLRFSAHGC